MLKKQLWLQDPITTGFFLNWFMQYCACEWFKKSTNEITCPMMASHMINIWNNWGGQQLDNSDGRSASHLPSSKTASSAAPSGLQLLERQRRWRRSPAGTRSACLRARPAAANTAELSRGRRREIRAPEAPDWRVSHAQPHFSNFVRVGDDVTEGVCGDAITQINRLTPTTWYRHVQTLLLNLHVTVATWLLTNAVLLWNNTPAATWSTWAHRQQLSSGAQLNCGPRLGLRPNTTRAITTELIIKGLGETLS